MSARPRRKRVVVKHDYDGVDMNQSLCVSIGEKLVVVKEFDGLAFGENILHSGGGGNGRGWFVAARSSNGDKGYVPKSYVTLLGGDNAKRRKPAADSTGGSVNRLKKSNNNSNKRLSVSEEIDSMQGEGKVRLIGSQPQKFSRPLPPQRRNNSNNSSNSGSSPSKRNTELISRGLSTPTLISSSPARGKSGSLGYRGGRGALNRGRGRGRGRGGRGRGGGGGGGGSVDREICLACGKKPMGADRFAAAGRSWHRACFKCTECGTALALGRENVFREHLFCDKCHRAASGVSGYGYSNNVQSRKTLVVSRSITSPALTSSGVCNCGARQSTQNGLFCSNCGHDLPK